MNIDKNTYKQYAQNRMKKSPVFRNTFNAFITGGLICTIGEILFTLYKMIPGFKIDDAKSLVSVTLVFLAALLTGIGVFDKIAKFAGAGTLVPITGFANAVVSPAIDTKVEGLVLGIGAKIFTIAGPVILYATLSGALYGVIYYVLKTCGVPL